MQLFLGALVVGAILMANSTSSVDSAKFQDINCGGVNTAMSSKGIESGGSIATYNLMLSIIPLLQPYERAAWDQLADAWRAVTYKEPCTSKSHKIVGTIGSCDPSRYKIMETLYNDTREYTKKCFPDLSQLDDILQTDMSGYFTKDSTGVTRLLDDDFIITYDRHITKKENLFPVRSFYCCWPERSEKAVVDSINRLYQTRNKKPNSELNNPKKVKSFLKQYLFKPCEKYNEKIGPLIGLLTMLEIINHQENGTWILEGLSNDIKNAVFRWNYCRLMIFSDQKRVIKRYVIKNFS